MVDEATGEFRYLPGFASLLSIIAIPPRWDIHDDTAAPYVAPL
jgi:hypothetical protein